MTETFSVDTNISINPIGFVQSPFSEKFAIPRQSSLVHNGIFYLRFYKPFNTPQAFMGIEEFSHLWVCFLFHQVPIKKFAPMVRPPRLGGNTQKGVFATRSPFRPNRIGLSVVKLLAVEEHNNEIALRIEGADLVDKTPILDIKPYIKFVDSITDANSGYATVPPKILPVDFTNIALEKIKATQIPNFKELITEVLGQDPRPAYLHGQDSAHCHGMMLYNINIIWQVCNNRFMVLDLEL